jgi:hypothetical protein
MHYSFYFPLWNLYKIDTPCVRAYGEILGSSWHNRERYAIGTPVPENIVAGGKCSVLVLHDSQLYASLQQPHQQHVVGCHEGKGGGLPCSRLEGGWLGLVLLVRRVLVTSNVNDEEWIAWNSLGDVIICPLGK